MGMAADENGSSKGWDLRLFCFGSDGRLLRCDTRKRKKALNPPPSPISKLQDDLLVEILSRLPDAGSAFRCRAVCRRWRSLLSNPDFRRSFLSRHHRHQSELPCVQPPLVLSSHDAPSVMNFLPVPEDIRPYFSILSSCRDLVLCGFDIPNEIAKDQKQLRRLFFVCNPFTKQWIALPLLPYKPVEVPHEQHSSPTVSLVCGSESDGNNKDDQVFIDRFRVIYFVRLWTGNRTPNLHVFCSESGEWSKMFLGEWSKTVRISTLSTRKEQMAWCDDKLYWQSDHLLNIAAWDPFRLDRPPAYIGAPGRGRRALVTDDLCASQGALHTVRLFSPGFPDQGVHVCRWSEKNGRETWRGLCEVSLRSCKYVGPCPEHFTHLEGVCGLHPSNPEIVFLEFAHAKLRTLRTMFSLNIRTKELTVFADRITDTEWWVFHPRFACWPSPIPSYEKLQGAYRGSCKWLVQSIESTRARKTAECQSVEGVEQLGRSRKHNRSEPSPQSLGSPVKKQKMVTDRSDQLVDVVHALQAIPELDDQLMLDACDLFEDNGEKAAVFLALDGRIRKKWLLRKLRPNDSV